MRTPFSLIQSLASWFFRKDGDLILQSGRTIVVSDTGVTVTIDNNGIVITGTGDVTIGGTSVSLDGHAHTHASTTGQTVNDHHNESHTVASHSDTSGTGTELNTLTDGSNADALHAHTAVGSHTIASHSDTSGTGSGTEHAHRWQRRQRITRSRWALFSGIRIQQQSRRVASAPLETGSGGGLQVVGFITSADTKVGGGLAVGTQTENPPGGMIMLPEQGAPGTPPSNWVYLYAKTDRKFYAKDDTGTETALW